MNEFAGVNIRLSRSEFEQLTDQAQRELRHPRDQARFLLRQALGLAREDLQPQLHRNCAGEVPEENPLATDAA